MEVVHEATRAISDVCYAPRVPISYWRPTKTVVRDDDFVGAPSQGPGVETRLACICALSFAFTELARAIATAPSAAPMTQAACVLCGVLVPEDASRCPACGGDLHVAERTLPPGTTLHDGKFNIGRVLGEGGFGITYKGVHTDLRRVVAIKEFFPTALGTGRTGNRVTVSASRKAAFDREQEGVLEEARTIAGLHCASIVEVYDVFRENGTVYIVLEYLEGQTLAERIQQAGRLAEADVASIGHALCDALEVIHAHRLLHRDVKPANVLLTREGRTVLIDFGSARTTPCSTPAS